MVIPISEPRRVTLTQAKVSKLSAPASGRPIVYDSKVPGFGLRLTPKGAKSFILRRKVDGRAQIVTIGGFPAVGVEQARKLAVGMNAAIARGESPQELKRANRNETTLRQLFREYMERHVRVHNRRPEEIERTFKIYVKPLASRRLSRITHRDVQGLHAQVGRDRGQYAANRMLALLHHMFNQARAWGYMKGDNPAHGIRRFKETKRDRFLAPEELPRFFKALEAELNETIRDYVLLSLLTGARKQAVLSMRWEEIDWEKGIWTIPGAKSKHGDPVQIPMHKEVVSLLRRRQERTVGGYVLPGPGKKGHLVNIQKGWRRLLERAGIQDFRVHDLRRTLGSWQAARGASLTIIGKSLGHRTVNTTAIYATLNLDPVRESMNGAIDDMLSAAATHS